MSEGVFSLSPDISVCPSHSLRCRETAEKVSRVSRLKTSLCVLSHPDKWVCVRCMHPFLSVVNPALCVCVHVLSSLSLTPWLIHRLGSITVKRPLINALNERSVWCAHGRLRPSAQASVECHTDNANHTQRRAGCKLWAMEALARCSSLSSWTRLSPAESVQSARSAINCLFIARPLYLSPSPSPGGTSRAQIIL